MLHRRKWIREQRGGKSGRIRNKANPGVLVTAPNKKGLKNKKKKEQRNKSSDLNLLSCFSSRLVTLAWRDALGIVQREDAAEMRGKNQRERSR